MQKKRWFILLVALLLVLTTAACSLLAEQALPEPTPTRTPLPTFTPTPEGQIANQPLWEADTSQPQATSEVAVALPTDTPTPIPTDTPTPAPPTPTPEPPTPTPVPPAVIITRDTVNIRRGPGTRYGILGRGSNGQKFLITGKNPKGDWWQIDFNGQTGWISDGIVQKEGQIDTVVVVAAIPPPPTPRPKPPTPTSPPPPPTSPPQPSFKWSYVEGSAVAAPQCGTVHFDGKVQYKNGTPQNGVCVLLDYYGPRTIKFSGGGGVGNGNWSFAPCGAGDCKGPFEIYVVGCPANVPDAGLTLNPGQAAPPPQSTKFTATVTNKCTTGQWTNIIFKNNQQ